jgi:hypothetical protein
MPTTADKPLNTRQLRAVQLHLGGASAVEAYARVYKCARASAEANAARLFGDPRVKALVDEARAKASAAVGITAEWFAQRVKIEAEREDEGSSHAARVAALRLAGMMLGLFTEKRQHEHSGPGGEPIKYDGKFLSTLTSEDLDALERILAGSSVTDRIDLYAGAFEKAAAREALKQPEN